MRLKIRDSCLTLKAANKCLNVRERVEVVVLWIASVCEENPDRKKNPSGLWLTPHAWQHNKQLLSKRFYFSEHIGSIWKCFFQFAETQISYFYILMPGVHKKVPCLNKLKTAGFFKYLWPFSGHQTSRVKWSLSKGNYLLYLLKFA